MAKRGSKADNGRSLNSIKLKDFPENQELADGFFDREFEENNDDETIVITRSEIPEDEDGSDGLTVRSLSSLFDDDDVSAGDTTLISREKLEKAISDGEGSEEPLDDSGLDNITLSEEDLGDSALSEDGLGDARPSEDDMAIASVAAGTSGAAGTSVEAEAPRRASGRPATSDKAEASVRDVDKTSSTTRKKKAKAPGKGEINRNPQSQVPKKTKPVKQSKVQDFGTKKHSAAYRIIKFCIFLLIWIAVAFACYQLYKFAYSVINDQPMDSTDASKIQVTVTGNETDDEMGKMLLSYGLINDVGIYKWRCRLYTSDYVPGTYKLSRSYNTEKILNILAGYNYSDGTLEEETDETAAAEESTVAAGEENAGNEGDGNAGEENAGDENSNDEEG